MKLKKLAASLLAAAMLFCGTATTAFADGGCDVDLDDILEGIEIGIPGIDIDDIDDIDIDVVKKWDRGTAEGEIQLPDPDDVNVKVKYGDDKWVSVDVDWDDEDDLATVIPEDAASVTWKGEIDLEDILEDIIEAIIADIIPSGGKAIQANGGFGWGDDLKEELKTILQKVITALTQSSTNMFGEEITGTDANQWSLKSTKFKLWEGFILNPTLTLTNTYTGNNGDGGDKEEEEDTVSITVDKVWEGDENYPNARPEKITVRLLADNKVVEGKTLTLSAANNWNDKFTDLKKYKDNTTTQEKITYTVEEEEVPGYEAEVTGGVENGFTITNTYKAPVEIKQNVTFTKEFEVTDGYTIPAGANFTFTFTLTPLIAELREAGEGNTIAPVTIEYSDKAVEVTFENVPAGTYTLTESYDGNWGTSIPNGVEVVVSANGVTFGGKSYSEEDPFTVTNTYNGDGYGEETFSIIVTKEWDDANNKDGIRPSSVTVELLALEDGELKVVDSADLNAGKDWTHIFTVRKYKESALLAFDDEFVEPDEIKYTIREESVPNGYTVSYKGLDKDDYVVFDDDEGSVIIKNSHTPTKEPTPIDRDDDDKEEKDDPDLTVRKVDKETDKLIKDQATFRIYKLSGSRKLYYTGSSWSSNVEKAKEYSTKNGKFTAYDLGAGTYYVEEVKAPSGYNLADDLKVNLTSKDKTVEFANSKAKQNPNTGALVLPLDLADAAVAAMTLGAAAWVISKSKK